MTLSKEFIAIHICTLKKTLYIGDYLLLHIVWKLAWSETVEVI